MSRRVQVIFNQKSGRRVDLRERLRAAFEPLGVEFAITAARSGRDLDGLARGALAQGYNVVAAVGGDGSVNAVATALKGTGAAVGVLPGGTFNYFARNLGVPLDLEGAARVVAEGPVAPVNLVEVNGHLVLNSSGFGLYELLIQTRERNYRRYGRRRWLASLATLTAALRTHYQFRAFVSTERGAMPVKTPLVFINNNRLQIDDLGLSACLEPDEFSCYILPRMHRPGILWLAFRSLLGHIHDPRLQPLCRREFRVEPRRRSMRVVIDGEIVTLTTPLVYRLRERAVNVVVPAHTDLYALGLSSVPVTHVDGDPIERGEPARQTA